MKLDTSLKNTIQIDGGHVPRGVVNFGVQKMALSMWVKCKMKLSRHAPAPLKTARQFLIDFFEITFKLFNADFEYGTPAIPVLSKVNRYLA